MRAYFLAMTLAVGAALSGCASIDESLFGSAAPAAEPATTPAPEAGTETAESTEGAAAPAPAEAAPAAPSEEGSAAPPAEGEAPAGESGQPMAGTLPSAAPPSAAAPVGAPAVAAPGGMGVAAGVGPVAIAAGPSTGTSVNQTIAGFRSSLQDIDTRMAGASQQLGTIRSSSAQQLATYHQAEAQIEAHLQIGTTRANPELVSQWNGAQSSLDQLTSNINALNSMVSQIDGDASRARGLLGQIRATFDVPGAVDEDHRQLTVLEDETNEIIVLLDRLGRDASADLRRVTASLASERTSLAQLQTAIKNGGFGGAAAPMRASRAAAVAPAVTIGSGAGSPVVTIRFARANVDYQKSLYEALNDALKAQPNASFDVVGVSPTRSSAAAVQTAQASARRHAQAVMHTMTEMGVPAARMNLSSSTDPSVSASEVRVFLR